MSVLAGIARWIEEGHVVSGVMLAAMGAAIIVSIEALRQARADVRLLQTRLGRDPAATGPENGATLLLARARVRSETSRLALLVVLSALEVLTISLPPVSDAMPDTLVALLALRKLGRVLMAGLLVAWLWADQVDRQRVLAHVRAARHRQP